MGKADSGRAEAQRTSMRAEPPDRTEHVLLQRRWAAVRGLHPAGSGTYDSASRRMHTALLLAHTSPAGACHQGAPGLPCPTLASRRPSPKSPLPRSSRRLDPPLLLQPAVAVSIAAAHARQTHTAQSDAARSPSRPRRSSRQHQAQTPPPQTHAASPQAQRSQGRHVCAR